MSFGSSSCMPPMASTITTRFVHVEIVKPERAFCTGDGSDEGESGHVQVTVTFAEHGGETCITTQMLLEPAAERGRVVRVFGAGVPGPKARSI